MKLNLVSGGLMVGVGFFLAILSLGRAEVISHLDLNVANASQFLLWGLLSIGTMATGDWGIRILFKKPGAPDTS